MKSIWDRAPTDAEMGYTKKDLAREKAAAHYTEWVNIAFNQLGAMKTDLIALPYVTYRNREFGEKSVYPIKEVIADYVDYDKPMAAFMAVMEQSKCPLVAAFKQALIDQYLESNLDELVEFDVSGE